MKNLIISLTVGTCLAMTAFGSVSAHDDTIKPLFAVHTLGTYAGTYHCSAGEQGMTLVIKDDGSSSTDPQGVMSRRVKGVLAFHPTFGNPHSPKGSFKISGTLIDGGIAGSAELTMGPDEWIEEPKNWRATGIVGVIFDGQFKGRITQPDGRERPGCSDMTLYAVPRG